MKSHWRRTLAIASLLAVALLVCVSGSASAANVVRVEIYSPTESSPVKWVRPGSTVTVTTWVTVDEAASVMVAANVGTSGWYSVTRIVTVPSSARELSVSVPLPEGITDGSKTVSVMARTDPNGDVKEASESDAVYVDGTAPVVTLGALPTTPTTNPRPTWTWSGTDPEGAPDCKSGLDYYIVTLDGELPFQTTGTSFTPSSDLVHGARVLKVKAVDKAGNVGTEQSFAAVTIDTAVPAAPAIKPILKGYNASPLTLKWNAITDGNNAITYVLQWAKDAGFSGAHEETIATGTQYEFSFTDDSANKGEGEYWFRVKTISTVRKADPSDPDDHDETKESGWSAVVSTIYDATAPPAPVMTLVTPSPTNEQLQQWSWTRTAPDIVRFQFGESANVAAEPTSYLLDGDVDNAVTNFTTDGVHWVMVRAIDAVGNVGAWSAAASVVVDLTSPGVPTGLATTPARVNAPQATWTWNTALDAASYEVELDGSAPVNVGYVGTHTAINLGEGIHTMRVRALDDLGNASGWTAAVNVGVDWTAPGPPPAPETTSPTASISQVWVWDALSDKDPFTYEVRVNGIGSIVSTGTNATHPSDLGDGEHYLQVRTKDDLGNMSAWSEKGWVIVDKIAPAAPVITLVTPSPTNEPLQQWSWTRTAVDMVRFQFGESADGTLEPTSYLLDGDVDNAVTNFTTDGTHYVMVRAIDAVGNLGAWSAAASVVVDLTPPGVPKNLKVQTPTRNNTPEWTWDAADNPNEDLAGYELLLDEAVVIDVGDVLSYTHSEMLSDGMHTMRARSYDRLGNSSAWTDPATSVLVDATPPEAPGMPRAESPTANRRPTWTWNATSGAVTYRVFLDGVAQQPVDTESNPNGIPQPGTTFTPAADLADGRHDLQVTAIDALGNESAKSAAGSVLVDGTAPAVPDIAHLPTYTKATRVVFRWSSIGDVAGYDFSYSLGDSDTWTTLEGITKQSYVVNDPDDGVSVKGRVRAYDSLRNTSGWSDTVSTTVDLTGPVVSITSPAAAKNTNLSAFTWTWTGSDGERGSGVQGYWVKLNDEAWSWTTGTVFTSSRLQNGVNILRVRGVDSVGNEGAIVAAPAVTLVDAVIFDIHPEPGAHPINEVSTIAFSVAGLYDGRVEVLLGDKPIEDGWRLVTVVRTPELAKFYVLLDADIMQPGMLTVTIRVGNSMISCAYRVLSERTGFGFGRLRPW